MIVDNNNIPSQRGIAKLNFEKFAEGLEEVINYIKTNCIKENGEVTGEKFTDVDFEEL